MNIQIIMKHFLTLLVLTFSTGMYSQLNMELVSNIQYDNGEEGNDIWGYTDEDGTEYAIMGTTEGVYIYNLEDPTNPSLVQFIQQQYSIWRDMKTWKNHAYVVADQGGSSDGILVINLNNLPGPITWENINPTVPLQGPIDHCHNIYIDEFGFAYLSGCNSGSGLIHDGAVLMFDVETDLGRPQYVGNCPEVYSHDVYVRDNIVYSSEINAGVLAIYDATDKQNVEKLAEQRTPFTFTHNAWLSDDSQVVFTTDEKPNAPVAAYDISDLANIKTLDTYQPQNTLGQGVIPHNVHVWNDYLVISYYTDGCKIVDAARPNNLIEVGNWDTYTGNLTGFQGNWGAYPFFDSGLIVLGDINAGFFVLKPDYKRAAYLEGTITDLVTGAPVINAQVEMEELSKSSYSKLDGIYRTGHGIAGTYTVTVSATGYKPQTREVVLDNGVLTIEDFQLEKFPTINISGTVTDAETGLPIEDAAVSIVRANIPLLIKTDAGGNFSTGGILAGDFDIIIGRWGYHTQILDPLNLDGDNPNSRIEVALEKGYADNYSIDLGWETTFSGIRGQLSRVKPIGHMNLFDVYIAPPNDSPEDEGDRAYITGQAAEIDFGLLLGEVELISPAFDVRDMEEPVVRFDYWYWATTDFGNLLDTEISMTIYNGTDSLVLESIIYGQLEEIDWKHSPAFSFKDQIALTDSMVFKFKTSNDGPSNFVEVGIDNFRIVELATVATESVSNELNVVNVFPNPTAGSFSINVEIDEVLFLDVYSQTGAQIEMNTKLNTDSVSVFGENYVPGIYYVVVRNKKGVVISTKRIAKI